MDLPTATYDPLVLDLLAQHAAEKPKSGPLPRRVHIYLVDKRPEINGRPMLVNRSDAREWCRAELAKDAPFSKAATGTPVEPAEYRKPEDLSRMPLVYNVNSGRYEPDRSMPTTTVTQGESLEQLVATRVAEEIAKLGVGALENAADKKPKRRKKSTEPTDPTSET